MQTRLAPGSQNNLLDELKKGFDKDLPIRRLSGKMRLGITVNLHVIRRILEALDNGGSAKRTQLALKSGLGYSKCAKYIVLLKVFGWIDLIIDESYYAVITQSGREILKTLTVIWNDSLAKSNHKYLR